MSEDGVKETHILIIGAGVTGLVIAHALQQAGIRYTIFESEDAGKKRPKEWTMGIHWSLPLLERLLPPRLASRIATDASVDPSLNYDEPPNNGAYIYDGVTGEVLKDLTPPTGRIVRVSRRKLRALCSECIDIKHGHVLQDVTTSEDSKTVTAKFMNEDSYTGTLLVGCDGPRSAVRSCLFKSEPGEAQAQAMQGGVTTSMAISYPDPEIARYVREKTHPVWCMSISPLLFHFMSMQDVPDPDRPETWRFFYFDSWLAKDQDEVEEFRDRGGDILAALKERGGKLAEPFRTALLSIPDETELRYSELIYWVAKPWDTRKGLMTLAGDSAHPMPPFRGQGGNHAIQDAHNFVEIVKQISQTTGEEAKSSLQAKAIQEYSDEVAKRGGEETNLSLKNGMMSMQYVDFKESPYMKQGLNKG
ncbi:hypothetical protein LTR37_018793 [Vermiconidia calcicola]|uniref:Uncharacterized protein n=1 Tax=Vermiconidia calcicola TaxID=1690605 RepID=A0ACC3MG89_9PEZI|nr:hypothetical protein LTR37_018793 [Vermiconidia calcicola]